MRSTSAIRASRRQIGLYVGAAALVLSGACGGASSPPPAAADPTDVVGSAPVETAPPPVPPAPTGTLEEPSFDRSATVEPGPSGKRAVRTAHPQPGQAGCVEMYGDCTPPPESLCTTKSLVIDCGKQALVPGTGEPVDCVCP